jgi:F-type H+-transporting ATPase subunit gamma
MEDIERIKEHLENIKSVEPIISSLRTIAAGGWQTALGRLRGSQGYVKDLTGVLSALRPHISPTQRARAHVLDQILTPRRALMLVVASERGLCGGYNDTVLSGADRLIARQALQSEKVLVSTLGARAESHFRAQGVDLFTHYPLPTTRVPSLEMVREIGTALRDALYQNKVEAIYVIYSPYKGPITMEPVCQRWLPIDASALPDQHGPWPPPIVETDKTSLFDHVVEEWTFVRLFQLIMESAASEQAARFRAMDNATNNLTRLIEEMTLSYHTARQHAITMEMLDLVAGAGLLRGTPEHPL